MRVNALEQREPGLEDDPTSKDNPSGDLSANSFRQLPMQVKHCKHQSYKGWYPERDQHAPRRLINDGPVHMMTTGNSSRNSDTYRRLNYDVS